MSRRHGAQVLVAVGTMLAAATQVLGQSASAQGTRFLLAAWSRESQADASDAPVLQRRVTLELNGVTLDQALKEIVDQADLEITYSSRLIPLDRQVSMHAAGITVGGALAQLLAGLPVDVSVTGGGSLALVQRRPSAAEPVDSGMIVGQVTDSAGGTPIVGATIAIEGTSRNAATDANGRFRITGIVPGTHIVRARYIGYHSLTSTVLVKVGQETVVDFVLQRSAQPLEQLVVTGSFVPTEMKAVPTPVSVIEARDIERRRPHTVQELFRQAVPTAVSWDFANGPYTTAYSTRGASTLGAGAQMKVFVDGLEVAHPGRSPVDPSSIERIEVIRGPQAAALYGSDAIGGVLQIFTKRGEGTGVLPRIHAEAGFGRVETPYTGFGAILRQNYAASVRGAGSDVNYNIGAGYSRTNDYLPDGELSKQSNPSVYGGVSYTGRMISLDVSGRYHTWNAPNVLNPELRHTGFVPFSKPNYQDSYVQSQAIGARMRVAPTDWWRNSVTIGFDRYATDMEQTQPRYTTPADTLLQVLNESRTKTSAGFSTSVEGQLDGVWSGSLTVGVDHWDLPISQFFTTGARNTNGTIQPGPGQSISASRTITRNTGYFAQMQVGLRDAVFITAGLRAEQNSDFGDSLSAPVSPRVGLSYMSGVGLARIKVRGSFGRAFRAPSPGLKLAAVTPTTVTISNPGLGPERQEGWDAGVDAEFGTTGTLSVTYYNQTAEDLIQFVQLPVEPVLTFQNQNVGRVKNTGVEIEGALTIGPVELKGQYGYTKAIIKQLAPNYTGDLRIGDQALSTPRSTAGLSFTLITPVKTTLSAGLTHVGSWTNYDQIARLRCLGGTADCRATPRDYITEYPGFVKLNATIWQQVTSLLSGFASVENITNNKAHEFGNQFPVMGRITSVGIRVNH